MIPNPHVFVLFVIRKQSKCAGAARLLRIARVEVLQGWRHSKNECCLAGVGAPPPKYLHPRNA